MRKPKTMLPNLKALVLDGVSSVKEFISGYGPIKTPVIGVSGYLTANWPHIKAWLSDAIVVGTFLIVMNHVIAAMIHRFCKKRYSGECGKCKLQGTFLCSKGMKDDEKV